MEVNILILSLQLRWKTHLLSLIFHEKRKKKHNIFVWDTLFLWKNEQSRKKLVMHDEMKTMVGWTQNGSNTDEGENTGTLKSDGERFVIDNFGAGSKWHGGVARKSLKEPLQDFTVEAIVECWNQNSAKSMGRVEIYLLDVNSDVIGKMTMAEVHVNVASNYGEIRAGKVNEGQHIISTTGILPDFERVVCELLVSETFGWPILLVF